MIQNGCRDDIVTEFVSVLSGKEQTKGKTSTFTDNQQITNPTGLIDQSASREKNERPSVNNAKDWLDQSFLYPDLVRS